MKKCRKGFGLLLLTTALALPAAATPSTLGFYPSTDISAPGSVHLDVDSYSKGLLNDATTSVGLTAGFGDQDKPLGRGEVGVDFLATAGGMTPRNSSGETLSPGKRLLFNAKAQLFSNDKTRLVAGLWGMGSDAIAAPKVGYVLGSHSFSWGRIHLGLAHSFAPAASISTPAGNDDDTYLTLGFDRSISKKLSFAVDYYSGKSALSGIQPTLYYTLSPTTSVGLGLMHFTDASMQPTRNQVYLCFDAQLGG